ncbi:Aste57867_20350 [Aphanomyces stellatus]|uniref:rRNA-processing protein EFG1 n=1 Tax=Aphanomyces stellatus TaxID=120398 RepID=A0A485LEQ6_9STRA|nr:hypothetical protein As57867_020284 [Aphanomyces stellatus]VFT97037.1 Aste57867_20350 [Aphanomyces stellatus]
MARPTAGTIMRMKKLATKPKKKTPSLKNKIRNLERFLKKDSLPDDVRQAKEEELKTLQAQTEDKQVEDKSREIALKYKKVKFFDRRRLMRTLKKLKRQIETSDDDAKADLEKQYQSAKEDMMFVYFYPKNEKYINLFQDEKKPHSKEDLTRQAELKKAAKKQFSKLDKTIAFDHFCFNDEATAPDESDKPTEKRKASDKDSKKRKDKRRKTSKAPAGAAAVDVDEAGAGGDEGDDFFL